MENGGYCESEKKCCKPSSLYPPQPPPGHPPSACDDGCDDDGCCETKKNLSPQQMEFSEDIFVNIISKVDLNVTKESSNSTCCQKIPKKGCCKEENDSLVPAEIADVAHEDEDGCCDSAAEDGCCDSASKDSCCDAISKDSCCDAVGKDVTYSEECESGMSGDSKSSHISKECGTVKASCCGGAKKAAIDSCLDECCSENQPVVQEKLNSSSGCNAVKPSTCASTKIPSACCLPGSTIKDSDERKPTEITASNAINQTTINLTTEEANDNINRPCGTGGQKTSQRADSTTKLKTADRSEGDGRGKETPVLLNKMTKKVTYGSFKCCDGDSDTNGCLFSCPRRDTQYAAVPCDTIDAEDTVKILPVVKVMATTKLRIQNICCGKEAELMKRELEPLNGIEAVSVNIVGRIGFVKHDTELITAAKIVTILNKLHLGVSIVESGHHDGDAALNREFTIKLGTKLAILFVLLVLFIVIIIGRVHNTGWKKYVAIAEIIVGGLPILRKTVMNWMKKIFIDINVLMLMAVIGTVALNEWIDGATLVFVFAIAEVLQEYCSYRVQKAISGLMVHVPDKAVLAETGESVPVEEVEIGTIIVICAGEKIALDGRVIKGQASVDESSITGESMPIEKSQGDEVYSGTIVQNGYLEIVTTSDSVNSTVAKVTQLVQEAQGKASRTEDIMNKFAKIYTPLVLTVAVLVFAIPAILAVSKVGNYAAELHWWGIRSLIVLLIACPCALVMSVPMPMVCGITAAARNGVLIKGGTHMEALATINTVAFDKTGTLTEGRFKVINIREVSRDLKYNDVMKMIAALEVKSSHPVASAIVNHYSGCITDKIAIFGAGVGLPDVSKFKSLPGLGLTGQVEGRKVAVGNMKMMENEKVDLLFEILTLFDKWSKGGQTVIFAAIDGELAMMIGLADTPRPTARLAINALKELNVNTIMLTGDSSGAAGSVRKAVGVQSFIANMKPEDKLQWIRDHQDGSDKRWAKIAMIGDGVNDGPSLAAANVGIAIGSCATALAIDSAGVALMSDSMVRIPELLVLAKFTRNVVWQNIFLAMSIKVAVMIATLIGSLTLWVAVLTDVGALLLVILNGFRPLLWKRKNIVKEREDFNYKFDYINSFDGDDEGIALIQIES